MERIVIGIDGSRSSVVAARWAAQLADRTGAEALAVHCYRRPYSEISPDDLDELVSERARVVADSWLPGDGEISSRVVVGDPRDSLLDAVAEARGDLLVLGRAGLGGTPGFLHLGSLVEYVAHHTEVPLAVIPTDAAWTIDRIVLGVDGSEASAAAVKWCADVAAATAATVVAVTVEEPIAEWTPSWDEHNWRRTAEHEVERWLEPLSGAGVDARIVVVEQLNVADGLLGVASARRADLLVVGGRGAGGFSGLRVGGTAMKALHRSSMPVVMVPPVAG